MPVLNQVVQQLTPQTWTKGMMVNQTSEGCQRCLAGWVVYAVIGKDSSDVRIDDTKAARVVAETIQRMYPDRVDDDDSTRTETMVAFNDHDDTTFEDVRRVVEKAAWREPILWE